MHAFQLNILAERAYEAYRKALLASVLPLPRWVELEPCFQQAWKRAVLATQVGSFMVR